MEEDYWVIPFSVHFLRPRNFVVRLLLGCICIFPTKSECQTSSPDKASPPATHGSPFLRVYPYDEIGDVSPIARLMFDPFGRVAVVREGAFAVLNDDAWLNLLQEGQLGMVRIIEGNDKRLYFGSRGAWGRAVFSKTGKLTPNPLLPKSVPAWTQFAFFDDIIGTQDGVYFGSEEGTVFLRYGSDQPVFFEIKNQSCLISIESRVFAATKTGDILELGPLGDEPVVHKILAGTPVVRLAIRLGSSKALLSTTSNKLLTFDGKEIRAWNDETDFDAKGRISCIRQMADGNVAVTELGSGLYIFSPDGHLQRSFTALRFQQISDIGCNEAGVLWLAAADSILKLLYNCPIEDFGHDLGLIPNWPLPVAYKGATYVTSDGVLYILEGQPRGETARFRAYNIQPPGGARNIACNESSLLVANSGGIYELQGTTFARVSEFAGLNSLAMISPDLCMASSPEEIGAFRFADGHWREICKRIPGVGYSPIAQASKHGLLLEMASNGVALAAFDPKLSILTLEKFKPWPDAYWTNASAIDDIIMFVGNQGQRKYYNPKTKQWITPEPIEAALQQSDQWILRLALGKDGTLWGVTAKSVVAFHPIDTGYEIDATSFDFINAFYPNPRVLSDGKVWFTAHQALYRADPAFRPAKEQTKKISITSVLETFSNRELTYDTIPAKLEPIKFYPTRNSFSIRLFSGNYNNRRPPDYAYRMDVGPWTPINSGSLLGFRDLSEGTYDLAITFASGPSATVAPTHVQFSIEPPWYRSIPAKICYAVVFVACLSIVIRASNRVARKRSEELETLISERTGQLEATMERLNEETRAAATFAERNRLAGEIHDSLQQGLSGAILQLDATINLPQIHSVVRQRLGIVRNMISFTRHEVQSAVWDKESPLLGDSELGVALHRLTAFINSDASRVQVEIKGEPRTLPTETKHHLMRIAQEATTNAVRHAKASRIVVILTYQPNELMMEICDDGVGFDQNAVMNIDHGHFGLRGLRSRAKRLNAELEIASNLGVGTKISLRIKA